MRIVGVVAVFLILIGLVVFGGHHQTAKKTSGDETGARQNQQSAGEHHDDAAAVIVPAKNAVPTWYKPGPGIHYVAFTLGGLVVGDGDSNSDNNRVVFEVHDEWAPKGAARFMELLQDNFFAPKQIRFFRCVQNFVIQFGISAATDVSRKWRDRNIEDDPVKSPGNAAGTLSFAMAGKGTRTSQIFYNLKSNSFLDGMGFSPFARVVAGAELMNRRINMKSGEKPVQGLIQQQGAAYLDKNFPDLSYIASAEEIKY